MSLDISIQSGGWVIISRIKPLIQFVRSLKFQGFMVVFFVTLCSLIIYSRILMASYDKNAYDYRVSTIREYGTTIANNLSVPGSVTKDSITEYESEIKYFSSMYDGRTLVIDKNLRVLFDTFGLEKDKTLISEDAIAKLQPIIKLEGTNEEKLAVIAEALKESETGLKGVEETRFILDMLKTSGLKNEIQLDLTLARGLNYYTGAIFEVKALDVQIGSITGGGRYDNLTGIFGMPGLSGVGISFGADRIYDVLNTLDLYPKESVQGTQLLFINFGEQETSYCLPIVAAARRAGIRTEMFPDKAKMKKQMSYANAKNIGFVALAGESEMEEGKVTLKNMTTGEQTLVTPEELIARVK